MNVEVPELVYWIWGITLAIAVFVILPLALYFLQRTLNAARSIERYFAEMRDAGVGIATHTGNIKALDNTIGVATQILTVAGSINEHAAAIENTFVARTGGDGRE